MLDEMLADCRSPEDILGQSGLLKQLTQRLIERALSGELNHHLTQEKSESVAIAATVMPQRQSDLSMENLISLFPETATAPLSRFWFPNTNVGLPNSTRKFWLFMLGV